MLRAMLRRWKTADGRSVLMIHYGNPQFWINGVKAELRRCDDAPNGRTHWVTDQGTVIMVATGTRQAWLDGEPLYPR